MKIVGVIAGSLSEYDEDATARLIGAASKAGADAKDADISLWYMADEGDPPQTPWPVGRVVIAEGCAPGRCTETALRALETLICEYEPDLLLFPADRMGRELAVRLSARVNIACSVDVLDFMSREGRLFVSKNIYSGNLKADFPCETPHILTVILSGFDAAASFVDSNVVRFYADANDTVSACRHIFIEAVKPEAGLETAGIVIVCGAGFSSEHAVSQANAIAGILGGVVGGTRPVAIDGRVPLSHIVGISGLQIKPKLCLVLGASGARAFATGIYNSACIVGVNTDAQAPLFKTCDAAAVCDAGEFARAFMGILKSDGVNGVE
jgi:electron transfer flavoprotein alpha subunit